MARLDSGPRDVVKAVFLIMLLIVLPLTGVILAGKPIDQYLEFPTPGMLNIRRSPGTRSSSWDSSPRCHSCRRLSAS
jgi:hypothetical protein